MNLWNENRRAAFEKTTGWQYRVFELCSVRRVTQARYSEASKGAHARVKTMELHALGRVHDRNKHHDYSSAEQRDLERGPVLVEVRTTGFDPLHLIILTDKPQKPLPAEFWEAPKLPAVVA